MTRTETHLQRSDSLCSKAKLLCLLSVPFPSCLFQNLVSLSCLIILILMPKHTSLYQCFFSFYEIYTGLPNVGVGVPLFDHPAFFQPPSCFFLLPHFFGNTQILSPSFKTPLLSALSPSSHHCFSDTAVTRVIRATSLTTSGPLLSQHPEHLTQLTIYSLNLTCKPPRYRTFLFLSIVLFPQATQERNFELRVGSALPHISFDSHWQYQKLIDASSLGKLYQDTEEQGNINGPQRQDAAGTQERSVLQTQEPVK